MSEDKELEECKKLNMLMDRWTELNEREAWESGEFDKMQKLREGLVKKYLPLISDLAMAGLLSYDFRTNRDILNEGHCIGFDVDHAFPNGNIVLGGCTRNGGTVEGSKGFDKLHKELLRTKKEGVQA